MAARGTVCRRRTGLVLLLVLLVDTATVKSSPSHTFRLSAIYEDPNPTQTLQESRSLALPNVVHSGVSADRKYGHISRGGQESFAVAHVHGAGKASVDHLLEPLTESGELNEMGLRGNAIVRDEPTLLQPGMDDRLEEKMEHILQRREERMTEDLLMKTLRIMEDMGRYDEKVQEMGDYGQTVLSVCGAAVSSTVEQVSILLGDEQDVVHVLTTVVLLQLHDCSSAALKIVTDLLAVTETDDSVTSTDDSDAASSSFVLKETEVTARLDGIATERDAEVQHHEDREGAERRAGTRRDPCDAVGECRQRGVTTVRRMLARRPSLLALYDVVATAVFGSSHRDAVAEALLDDVMEDFDITRLDMKLSRSFVDRVGWSNRLSKRSSCVDKKEAKAQKVISWIPFLGTVYNLISSAVYAIDGCKDVAEARAIEGAMDLAMDAATALTFGAAGGVAQGAKVLIKGGMKMGMKSAFKASAKAAGKSFRKVVKKMIKETVKGYKNPIKGALREVKDTVQSVYKLGKAIPKVVKAAPVVFREGGEAVRKGFKKFTQKGVVRCRRSEGQCAKQLKLGDIDVSQQGPSSSQQGPSSSQQGPSSNRQGSSSSQQGPSSNQQGSSSNQQGPSSNQQGSSSNQQSVNPQQSFEAQLIQQRDKKFQKTKWSTTRDRHAQPWDDQWNQHKLAQTDLPRKADGKTVYTKALKGIDLRASDLTNKKQFQMLQEKAAENAPLYVKQNLGGVDVSYVITRQRYKNSKDQVLIKFEGTLKNQKIGIEQRGATYDDIFRQLDTYAESFDDQTVAKRADMVDAMRSAIRTKHQTADSTFPGSTVLDLNTVFGTNDLAKKAASEFIVLTQLAEAVPARIKGNDRYFRAFLSEIKAQEMTFQELNQKAGIVTGSGQLKYGKRFGNVNDDLDTESRFKALTISQHGETDPHKVSGVLNAMSDGSDRRR